ncbi:toxin YoeB [Desulfosarcina sp. BuS5]|uniref:Txe/YoeB family addiction module toxin n=1 Tax=Desulfosarcina sp. BuS5 TaxID=933262 RepID=UPI00279A2338|nr:toxin YoeB [Desulfosarcina sp. BuS5]
MIISFGRTPIKKVLRRINTLIKEMKRNPFEGVGKPEPLKHALSGYWSRRITDDTGSFIKYLKMQFISPSCATTTDHFL